ncbi:MAG TPA: metallophosphoesterase [Polyangiaceae bacterium]|jgi:predicted phosphodiesterase|nr:metallophosphoesterase [Polyangiaceae bacterium]
MGVVALLVASCVACVGVTEERAQRDETVGKGGIAGATFEVVDGLGAWRQLEPGAVSLWAKAPTIEIKVTLGENAPAGWTLRVTNTLPDAVLEATADSEAAPLATELLSSAIRTEKQWGFTLPVGASTLRVHSARGEPAGPWRFALLSDIQEAIDRVQDIYARINADPSIAFVVSAGDLTRRGDVEELERFQRELTSLRVPFFPTLGNHELGTDDGAPFQRHFGRASFRFVYGGMQFTFLDSGSATIDPLVYGWLDNWLAEGRHRTHAVLMHIPPIDPIGVRNGSFANRNEGNKLLAKLAAGGVDVTLYGHIHSYYPFANAGIPAYISGGGGSIPERFDGIGRHYLTVDVDPARGITQTGVVRIDPD